MYMCVRAHICRCLQGLKEGAGSHGARVPDECEPPDMGAGNWTLVLNYWAISPACGNRLLYNKIMGTEKALPCGLLAMRAPVLKPRQSFYSGSGTKIKFHAWHPRFFTVWLRPTSLVTNSCILILLWYYWGIFFETWSCSVALVGL